MEMDEFFQSNGWTIAHDVTEPAHAAQFVSPIGLRLRPASMRVLSSPAYASGIYRHQYDAIRAFQSGQDVCLSTATASGKTLVFNLCALELLCRRTTGVVLAIYPLKALTDEQESKWKAIAEASGTQVRVGRIDGSVPVKSREKILSSSSIVVATPDVIHAWLLSNVGKPSVKNFLRNLQLIVIDEAHAYTGVFGSNAAYLFRRLEHLSRLLGASPRYIAASATIREPETHLKLLTGRTFHVIDQSHDSSGRNSRRLIMARPPEGSDLLTSITGFIRHVVSETSHQFVTFVDSRKQAEQMASVLRRAAPGESDDEDPDRAMLAMLNVMPFRAGYEPHDRKAIQEKLNHNELRGVVSTSALEMGIDIPSLTMGILVGIPPSITSYYQRIGRIGRHGPGTIVIVDDGAVLSRRVFAKPGLLDQLPLAEGALYLENARVQYIHAMCLARPGGEHESIQPEPGSGAMQEPHADFLPSFLALCQQENVGAVPIDLQPMKAEAANDPNYAFPLRDCEPSLQVLSVSAGVKERLGTLSYAQVMREAYPGAVYYYQTTPYRITRVNRRERTILARPEKRYTTKPIQVPAMIFPNVASGSVFSVLAYGDLAVIECKLQVVESIRGYKERRGSTETGEQYPLQDVNGVYYDHDRFERYYFTTGVLIAHPALSASGVDRQLLSLILYEAFLMVVPFERQDIRYGADKFRTPASGITTCSEFLCVYDQTYGSLRLNNRLMEPEILRATLERAVDIAESEFIEPALAEKISEVDIDALQALLRLVQDEPTPISVEPGEIELPQNTVLVIMPGSFGLAVDFQHEEYSVEDVRFTPRGIVYKGKRKSQMTNKKFENIVCSIPVDRIEPIIGKSILGTFDMDTGDVKEQGIAKHGVSFD